MALYKHGTDLTQSTDKAFDQLNGPGTAAPWAGIYKCTSCGDEIAIAGGHILPPQNHRQHDPTKGPIQWRLTVHPVSQK
jgi:hypothetical protein